MVFSVGKENGYEKNIRDKAQKIKNLTYLSYVPYEEIQGYYDRASVVLNTSKQEGFPNSFLHAGIARAALLSFTVNPNHMFDHEIGTCAAGNAKDFFSTLTSVTSNAEQYGQALHSYVSKHHDRDTNARNFLDSALSAVENK